MTPQAGASRPIFLIAQMTIATPPRLRIRGDDSAVLSGRPIFVGFSENLRLRRFRRLRKVVPKPYFCQTSTKVADSADSAKIECVVLTDLMGMPFHPIFVGFLKTGP